MIDALHDAPDFAIEPAAHLLAALAPQFAKNAVFIAVVDPGVGGERDAIVIKAGGQIFVGPDNGLLAIVWQRARRRQCWRIRWRPARITSSFHGRDLFAPVAAALSTQQTPRDWLVVKPAPDVLLQAGDLARVIYVDHYGNALTGLREFKKDWTLCAGARGMRYARTFDDAKRPFWYQNSMGLVEIAVPHGAAAKLLKLKVGAPVAWQRSTR